MSFFPVYLYGVFWHRPQIEMTNGLVPSKRPVKQNCTVFLNYVHLYSPFTSVNHGILVRKHFLHAPVYILHKTAKI